MLAVALSSAACQDLQVDNLNAPDRERAITNASDVQNLIVGTFPVLWTPIQNRASSALLWSAWGEESTTTSQVGGLYLAATQHPIQPLLNDANLNVSTGPTGPVNSWLDFHRVASSNNDAIIAITKDGITMDTPAETQRALAAAYFLRGLAWGYLANGWAHSTIIDENVEFGTDANAVVKANLQAYPEALAASIASLDKAIAIATATPFTVPVDWFRTADPVSSAELIRIANSYKAKFMVYNARTPQERAAVNWAEVLRLTAPAAAVTRDFAPVTSAASGGLVSNYLRQLQLNSIGGLQQSRADYELIGPADVSGNWQAYINTPVPQRQKIEITTPDKRIQSAGPRSSGSYFRFVVNPNGDPDTVYGFLSDRGLFNFSNYQYFRHGTGSAGNGVPVNIAVPLMGVDENRLIRAEALLRTGDLAGAAAAINVSRTRGGSRAGTPTYTSNLPPVTAAPLGTSATGTTATDCVPRKRSGACGDLLDALIYERRIELTATDGLRAYTDARGFGLLKEGTPIHMPVPGRELEALGLPGYSYGGVGGNCAAGSTCVLPTFN